MATAKNNQTPSDMEEYLRDLLECPVCMETIKSVPVYQCANGHVICKDCIEKLNNCPICRNDSELRRSLKLEDIVQRLEGILPGNVGSPNLQKWGKGSVRSYGTINGPNQAAVPIGINFQANPGHSTTRQVTTGPVTTRQVLSRPVNNQDVEAGLQRNQTRNCGECLWMFMRVIGSLFLAIILWLFLSCIVYLFIQLTLGRI